MKEKNRTRLETILIIAAVLIPAGAFFLFPLYWDVNTSFKLEKDVMRFPPLFMPNPANLEAWGLVLFNRGSTPVSLGNSFIVASSTTLLSLIISAPAAYSLARARFRHKEALGFGLIAPLLIGGVVILIPLYALMATIGLINTLFSVIFLTTIWASPIVIWILRGFFERIPVEVEESALIDGCSRIGALARVTLPVAANGIGAAAIYTFVVSWNEFWIPFIFTSATEVQTAPLNVYGFFIASYETFWAQFGAYTTLAILPPIILFLLFQKIFVQGLTRGAIKG